MSWQTGIIRCGSIQTGFYNYLKNEFEWPTKDTDLAEFCRVFPKALETIPSVKGPEAEANLMIRRFWKGWEQIRREAVERGDFRLEDDILMLEGHRPVVQYVREMQNAGFRVNTDYLNITMVINPWPVIPTSGLLYVTVGQKV